MTGPTLRKTVLITNPQGFHLRPVAAFAKIALRFPSCRVRVLKEDRTADGTSPLDLMTLAAEAGSELTIEVSGPDAGTVLAALAEVVNVPPEESPPCK